MHYTGELALTGELQPSREFIDCARQLVEASCALSGWLLASVCALGAGLGSGPPARTEPLAEAHARALHQDTEWYTRVIGKGRDGARVKAPEDRFAAAPADFYTTTDGHRIYRPQVDAVALNVWPDLPSFKSLLRREIKWRLALAGPRIADSVRDEAKWRLRVYLALIHN